MYVAVLHILSNSRDIASLHRDTTALGTTASARKKRTERLTGRDRQRAKVKTLVESILYAESIKKPGITERKRQALT